MIAFSMSQIMVFIICAIIFGVIGYGLRTLTQKLECKLNNWINYGMLPCLKDTTIQDWMQTYGSQYQNIVFTIFGPYETYHSRGNSSKTQYVEAIWVIIRVSVGEPNRDSCESKFDVFYSSFAPVQDHQQPPAAPHAHVQAQAQYPMQAMQVQQGLPVGQHDQMQYPPQQQLQQVTQPYYPNMQAQQMQAPLAQGANGQMYVQQPSMQQPYQSNQQLYNAQYSQPMQQAYAQSQNPLPPPSMQFNQNQYTYSNAQQTGHTVPSAPPPVYKEGEPEEPPPYEP